MSRVVCAFLAGGCYLAAIALYTSMGDDSPRSLGLGVVVLIAGGIGFVLAAGQDGGEQQ